MEKQRSASLPDGVAALTGILKNHFQVKITETAPHVKFMYCILQKQRAAANVVASIKVKPVHLLLIAA